MVVAHTRGRETLTTMGNTHTQGEREEGEKKSIIHTSSTHKQDETNIPDGLNTRFIQNNQPTFSLIMVAFL